MGVREGLLALLDDGPRYGYQLKTSFEGATGGVWPLNVGQVYTTLDRLHRDGLVTVLDGSDGEAAKKSYELTPAGREELGAWWRAVPTDDPPPRDELMLKMLLAIEHGQRHALDVLTEHRTALLALLQQRRRESRTGDSTLASRLVADALVVRAEADLRWLDLCEARLQTPGDARIPQGDLQ
jgi:DNA-binding PadR family transcriptional regulator